jgi:hypothetical protein
MLTRYNYRECLFLLKCTSGKHDKYLWQVHDKSYKVDVRLFFILAAHIAFWVFAHCIFGLSVLIKIENFARYIN